MMNQTSTIASITTVAVTGLNNTTTEDTLMAIFALISVVGVLFVAIFSRIWLFCRD